MINMYIIIFIKYNIFYIIYIDIYTLSQVIFHCMF